MGLSRFVAAQNPVWPQVMAELAAGRKQSHWIWFVFPQLRGLGHSPNADYYGLADLAEARAYAAHAVLGPRYGAAARALLTHAGTPAEAILGPVDALKLRSSATLFARAGAGPEPGALIEAYFGGGEDALTLDLLAR
jgi:uncharacterized protein (DUF1810 family)